MTAWPRRRVADLIDGLTAGVSVRSTTAAAGGPAVLKTSAIDAGLFDPSESKAILPADLPRARCPVAADSLIVSRMNTPALVGDVGYVAESHEEIFLPDRLWLARAKRRSGIDMRWLTYYFASEPGARELRGLATGTSGSMKNIPKERVLALEISVPPEPEQRAIARTLADADDLIVTLERLIAKKHAIRQGMMQQLLTGRTRLPGFTGSWGARKIGDFAQVRAGGTPSTAVQEFWGGDIPWMSSGEIHKKQVFEVEGRITALGLQRSSAQLFPAGTVLMALAGQGKTRGTVAVSRVELTTNQSIAGIYPGVAHDPDYLYYNLDTRYSELRGESTGDGGRGGLNLTIIKNVEVPFPQLEEQSAIAAVLRDIDSAVDALELQLSKARAIKTGMMQQLLTGRTRLPAEATS